MFEKPRVPCLTAELDIEEILITTRAFVDGEEVAESTTGLFWIPIEKLPNAKGLQSVEVTFKSRDEHDDGPPTLTTLQFEIPDEFQQQVRARVEKAEAFDQAVADASRPTCQVNEDGDGFTTDNFEGYFGCYGKAYPPKFNDGKGVSVTIAKCPDTVTSTSLPSGLAEPLKINSHQSNGCYKPRGRIGRKASTSTSDPFRSSR